MWGFNNVWANGRNTEMASYNAMMHEIHVLLVDHDSESLINTAKLLEMCQYKVTYVGLASAAITMLQSGKTKFDVVMANINSPDLYGFKLLNIAVNLDLPVVLMSIEDNSIMAMRALENGAFLYIKKPATIELLQCLWQHVVREKMRGIKERDRLVAANYGPSRGIEFRDHVIHHDEQNPSNVEVMTMMKNKCKPKKKNKGRKGMDPEDDEYGSDTHVINNNVKRKMCTEWTDELHAKFMNAVEQLGEGRCFPKEILELMDVPGLTRMQVASHLQKCRNDNWRSPEERRSYQAIPPVADTYGPQPKPRRFGSKPQLGKALSYQSQESPGTGQGSETQSEADQIQNSGGGNVNMGSPPIMANNTSHDQLHYGSVNARPGPSNPRHPSDDFFNFPDMDTLMQNMAVMPQGSGPSNPNLQGTDHGDYQFNQAYPEQDAAAVDSKSQWSPEASNFASDDSETKGQE